MTDLQNSDMRHIM